MKSTSIKIAFLLVLGLLLNGCSVQTVTVKENQFFKDGKPYYFVGANYWYGALLASKSVGDRPRLLRELDLMKQNGIDNLRILVGAEGGSYDYTVTDALQPSKGVYNQDLLEGLDYLLAEMQKREMVAVLYLGNNWEWSGGMSQYLEWNGYGKIPNPNLKPNTWPQFMQYTSQFHSCEPCKSDFRDHVKYIISRTNTVTGKKYTTDKAIMAWQVANEPRVFNKENEAAFTNWLNDIVDYINTLDRRHLISTGSEGMAGSNDDIATFERTHRNKNIDYLTMHIWPKNWGWYQIEDEDASTELAIQKALDYVEQHVAVANRLNRPIVLEEFGLPREKESLLESASVANRNKLYDAFFSRLAQSSAQQQSFAGANFWGFGGEGRAVNPTGKWNDGDAFTADPPQEPQGLNTVFSSDAATLGLIRSWNLKLGKD